MTSELRPAVEVWWKATDAWKEGLSPEDATQAAAAVIEADREAVRAHWYRQGKDDGWQMCKENEIDRLREELAEAYIKLSGKSIHTSDCATSNAPAMEPGPCNCDAPGDADLVSKLRDEDSYYRLQEKHWCIDSEELERQRLAAAAEIERLRIALHEIDIEAANTIPPDGKDAAFAALFRIAQIINPFRLPRAALAGDSHDQ